MTKKITPEMEEQFIKDAEEAMALPRSEQKLRITTMVDGDVLDTLKERAAEKGMKYQTYLNVILRESLFGAKDDPLQEAFKLFQASMKNVELSYIGNAKTEKKVDELAKEIKTMTEAFQAQAKKQA